MARQRSTLLLPVLTEIVLHWMHFSRGAVFSSPTTCSQSMLPHPGTRC